MKRPRSALKVTFCMGVSDPGKPVDLGGEGGPLIRGMGEAHE